MSSRPLLLGATGVALVACTSVAGPPPYAVSPASAGAPSAVIPPPVDFAPRLVRRYETEPAARGTQASGTFRRVDGDFWHERVFDPETGIVYDDALIPFATTAIDPSFRVLCVGQREFSPASPAYLGAYDLWARKWLWRHQQPPEVRERPTPVLATPELCAFGYGNGRIDLRARTDGARVDPGTIPFISTNSGTVARWTDDRSTVVLTLPTETDTHVPAILVDVRDGRTLMRRSTFWARCIEVGTGIRGVIHEGLETPAARARIARELSLTGGCREPPPVLSVTRRAGIRLPDPWIPLSESTIAFHGDAGLYLWDHGHERAPLRIDGAPPITRYVDVDGSSRPLELTVPPDASWVGAMREDGKLARFQTLDGAPLPEVTLPGPLPVAARDAGWQVMAGARDRLIAIRGVGGRRIVFVGDISGGWQSSRARVQRSIWQSAEHLDAERIWLLGDEVHGAQRLDEVTGNVTAAFAPAPASFRRTERPLRSPDGRQLFLATATSSGDDLGGLRFLDARTLRVLRRLPYVEGMGRAESWDPEGIVFFDVAGLATEAFWRRMDPATGSLQPLALGDNRFSWEQVRRGQTHVDRALDGGALVGGPRGTPERWISIVDGGGVIEYPDGRVFCSGGGCAVHRCVVGPRDARPATDPACAHLLRRETGHPMR